MRSAWFALAGLAIAVGISGLMWHRHRRTGPRPPENPHSTVDDPPGERAFAGTVVDETGHPVAGATITLSARPVKLATSGPDGSYRFDHLLSRPYWVEASLDDRYADRVAVRVTEHVAPVTLTLHPGAQITVRVVQGGDPLANAQVVLDPWPTPDAYSLYVGVAAAYHNAPHRGTTDAKGTVVFRGVSPREHMLHVEAADPKQPWHDEPLNVRGSAPMSAEVVMRPDADDHRWQVSRELVDDKDPAADTDPQVLTVDGRVIDEQGARVPFAEVSLGSEVAPNFVTADAHGEFRVRSRFFDSMYQVVARDAERSSSVINPGWVERGRDDHHVTLELVLHDGMIDGSVVDAHGAPVAGAWVHAGTFIIPIVGASAVTDASGRFRLGPLPRQAVKLEAGTFDSDRHSQADARPGDRAVRLTL